MNWNLVSLEERPAVAWRNGGGTTRELLAWPDAAQWSVRLSVADVERAGPFSRFDGIERWFAVLDGDGVVLRGSFPEQRLTAVSDPLRFAGEDIVDCELVQGATRDFNLMALPGRARMQRVRGPAEVQGPAAALLALYTHEVGASLHCDGDSVTLPPYHLAWTVAQAPLRARLQAHDVLWMEAFP